MLIMNFSNPRNKEQPAKHDKFQQQHVQTGWSVSPYHDAPFDCIRIHSEGLKNVTEVASIDAVIEQFTSGGGSIARPKMYIPDIGTLISCSDCVGHLFTFFEAESPVRPEKITGII